MACTDVIEPFLVVVIRSCICPMSVAKVGWYPTAEGIRPSKADTSEPNTVRSKRSTGLGKSKDVVDEEQDVLSLLVPEILGNRQAGQRDSGACTRRLIHLAKDESSLAVAVDIDDTRCLHLVVQVIAFSRSLSDLCMHTDVSGMCASSVRQQRPNSLREL